MATGGLGYQLSKIMNINYKETEQKYEMLFDF